MLKKYLQQCNSREYFEQKKVKSKHEQTSKSSFQLDSLNPDSSSKTIETQPLKSRLNLRQPNQNNYYGGAKSKVGSQHMNSFQQNALHPPHQQSDRNKQISLERTPIKYGDFEQTKKQEENKFRSLSFQRKHLITKQPQSEERCQSNEKIKVFDVFNQTPKQLQKNTISQKLLIINQGFKEKVVYQSQSKTGQQRLSVNQKQSIIENNKYCQPIKAPISSRLNDSKDLIAKLNRKSTVEIQKNENKNVGNNMNVNTFGNNNKSDRKTNQSLKSFFLNNPATQNDQIPSKPYQVGFHQRNNIQQRNLRIDLEKCKNDNILELLLLTTGELKDKFQQEGLRKVSEERQLKSAIRVRAGNKFPLDFFQ